MRRRTLALGPPDGPAVDWDNCADCGKPIGKDEERFRSKDGNGVRHAACG